MRWFLRITLVLAVLLALYTLWPLWSLYRLAHVVETRDATALNERIDFGSLRTSLAFQIARTYLQVSGQDRRLGPLATNLAVGFGVSVADPLVAQFVTPEGVAELLAKGWPDKLAGEAPAAGEVGAGGIRPGDLGSVWQIFLAARYSWRNFSVSLPFSRPPAQRFRLRLRLVSGTWKLAEVDLPQELYLRFAHVIIKTTTQ